MGNMDAVREQRMRAQLEAIEARLAEHPQVAGAMAAVSNDRLIAYVVPYPGQAPVEDVLREHVKASLPAYMVPRHFIMIDSLPLAPDGTVDRNNLPDPQSALPGAHASIAMPREEQDARTAYLAAIWSHLLDRDVGPDDNFFDLGGHSMLAVQMANRVKVDTGVRIQLMTLASQTLAQIAAELPAGVKTASPGFGARIVGNLRGILRGSGTARQS